MEFYSVKKIISPETIELNNGLQIKLLGIKEKKDVNGKAKEFLQMKTKGQKVFIKFDEKKYDNENRLLAYVYLKNKTFLNAHLIKNGLAEVDTSYDFKYKNKFLKLLAQNGKKQKRHS